MNLSAEFLSMLCCPVCKGELKHKKEDSQLVCPACQKGYPIRDGLPVLLVEQSSPVT